MDTKIDASGLAECVAPLPDEARVALRQYWEQVIREEWEPPARRRSRAAPLPEDGQRERREARRAVSRIATGSRLSGSGVAA